MVFIFFERGINRTLNYRSRSKSYDQATLSGRIEMRLLVKYALLIFSSVTITK